MDPSCKPEQVEPFVGKHKSELPAEFTGGNVRVIGPNMAVTMDYVPSRLNILTDEDGIVQKAHCG